METFISGLLLAAVTGLAIIAYRHPSGYKKIFIFLFVTVGVVSLGISVWDLAVEIGFGQVIPFLKTDSDGYDKARAAIRTVQINLGWLFLGTVATIIYLNILYFLPKILSGENTAKDSSEKPGTHVADKSDAT